jgi:hypothetical protein
MLAARRAFGPPTPEFRVTQPHRYLLCSRKDGIGARLVNLLWTWRLARAGGLRTLCFWPPMDPYYGSTSGVGDLIDRLALATGPISDELRIIDGRPSDMLNPVVTRVDPDRPCDPAALAYSLGRIRGSKSPAVPVIDNGGPMLTAGEDPAAAAEQVRALFASLPLAPRIEKSVKAVAKDHNFSRLVAVHVRGGDIVEVLREACEGFTPEALEPDSDLDRYTDHFFRGYAPSPACVRLLRPYLQQDFGLLFFSDTPGAVDPFQKKFPYKLIKADDLAPVPLNEIQRALFEILMMSRCHAIIGAKSMFSTLASLIGGVPIQDARRQATPEEFLGAYKWASGFERLAPEIQAGVSQVMLRKLGQNGLQEQWNADGETVLRILAEA